MSKEDILKQSKPMSNKEWNNFGYESSKPCCICGKDGNCKSEPRFAYTVCQDHANINPIDVSLFK